MPDKVRFDVRSGTAEYDQERHERQVAHLPTPKPLVQFGKVTVVNRGACIEYKGLGHGARPCRAASKNTARAHSRGPSP